MTSHPASFADELTDKPWTTWPDAQSHTARYITELLIRRTLTVSVTQTEHVAERCRASLCKKGCLRTSPQPGAVTMSACVGAHTVADNAEKSRRRCCFRHIARLRSALGCEAQCPASRRELPCDREADRTNCLVQKAAAVHHREVCFHAQGAVTSRPTMPAWSRLAARASAGVPSAPGMLAAARHSVPQPLGGMNTQRQTKQASGDAGRTPIVMLPLLSSPSHMSSCNRRSVFSLSPMDSLIVAD